MADAGLPTPHQLRQLIDYNADTGLMIWKPRTADMFTEGEPGVRRARSPQHKCANWNAKLAGTPALATIDSRHGYLFGNIKLFRAAPFKAHRVAWAIFHGEWPAGSIDHINGDPGDNRIANLRDVPQQINMRNTKRRADNQSGFSGVSWFAQTSRWQVRVSDKHIGFFKDINLAVAARDAARAGMGYTARGDK